VLRSLRQSPHRIASALAVTALTLTAAPAAFATPCPEKPPPPTIVRTTTTLTVSSDTVVYPGTVVAAATVSGGAGSRGELSITVDDKAAAAAAPGSEPLQTTIGPLSVGDHTVQASYSGAEIMRGPPACHDVGTIIQASHSSAATVTVRPQHFATSLTVDAPPADDTQPLTVSAHVGSEAATAATGTVSFAVAGRQQDASVDDAGNAATTFDPLPAGTHSLSVAYSGGASGNLAFDASQVDLSLAVVATPPAAAARPDPPATSDPPVAAADQVSAPLMVPAPAAPLAESGAASGAPVGALGAAVRGRRARARRKELRVRADDRWTWTKGAPGTTRMNKLVITSAPAASTVRVTCHGAGCPDQRPWQRRRRARLDVGRHFGTAPLAPGTRLVVDIVRRGFVGFRITYTIHAGRRPQMSWRRTDSPSAMRLPSNRRSG
jgi:hypothetical protein